MVKTAFAAGLIALVLGALPAAAQTGGPQGMSARRSELSAQSRRPAPRVRVYPGRLLYRDCDFRLVPQWRPSGAVIVPWQHCWWVRG